MRILFVSGAGILPEQRINRWKMVSKLYSEMGGALRSLGHQTYYYVHPEAWDDALPPEMVWVHPDHEHFPHVLESFAPDFVFCWNGSSPGDLITATLAAAAGAKMLFSEQGWFPQSKTLYFDMTGTNARCSTRHKFYPALDDKSQSRFIKLRSDYLKAIGMEQLFDSTAFSIAPPDLSKPIFVPLQDERDLNIVQDAPFKKMDEFVGFLHERLPGMTLLVRPHPKFPNPHLSEYANVVIDDPKKPMFQSLSECGMVVGINSTTLLESALLGKTVVSYGESLATGSGLLCDLRPGDTLDPETIRVNSDTASSVLLALLKKQMPRNSLSSPIELMQSSVFSELRTSAGIKPLQAWI
jgi:hypothetical protein